MSEFINPYQFVPLARGPDQPPGTVPARDRDLWPEHLTHERFAKDAYSGRMICRVDVESPMLIANEQSSREGWTKLLHPFEWTNNEPAIPASALRGMLSSLAEAATNSAFRVLDDRSLSHRVARGQSLSALGILVDRPRPGGGTELRLVPLTVPTIEGANGQWRLPAAYTRMFQAEFQQPLLRVYVDGYHRKGSPACRPSIEVVPGSFLDSNAPKSRSADHEEYWYLQLNGNCSLDQRGRVQVDFPKMKGPGHKQFLLGQRATGRPISQADYDQLPDAEKGRYTRGILRVLGIEGREHEIPTSKTHEIFIPLPPGITWPDFEVQGAIDRFHKLADERTEEDPVLPFEVAGSRRNGSSEPGNNKLRLRADDLVFFRPDANRPEEVQEVSVSSIWRSSVGSVYQYVAAVSPELLPFHHGRNTLTLVEQLFGVVESGREEQPGTLGAASFSLAGRVRVSFGRLVSRPEGGAYGAANEFLNPSQREALAEVKQNASEIQDVPLKNLASPKPPCPAFYFTPKDGHGYIAKRDLNLAAHQLRGRKFYVHHPQAPDGDAFIHADRIREAGKKPEPRKAIGKQHASPEKLVRPGTAFYFHLDFENLSRLELQLLCYAVRPAEEFRHQLGHGKPLGLGRVKLTPEGLFVINRKQRYDTDGLGGAQARYHSVWVDKRGDKPVSTAWPEMYEREKREVPQAGHSADSAQTLRDEFRNWARGPAKLGHVLDALEIIGNPAAVSNTGAPVHYPQIAGREGRDLETEHFKWFQANDEHRSTSLPPVAPPPTGQPPTIPTLPRDLNSHAAPAPSPRTKVAARAVHPPHPVRPSAGAARPVASEQQAVNSPKPPGGTSSPPLKPEDLKGQKITVTMTDFDPKESRIILSVEVSVGADKKAFEGYLEESKPRQSQLWQLRQPDGKLEVVVSHFDSRRKRFQLRLPKADA